ncbi:MAG: Rid family hydrolase [Trueperaceae bacterium]
MKLINPVKCPPQNPSFSQASVTSGATVYVSGQIGIEPATGKLAADDIAGQTERIFRNLQCILEEAGSCLEKVVKTRSSLWTCRSGAR